MNLLDMCFMSAEALSSEGKKKLGVKVVLQFFTRHEKPLLAWKEVWRQFVGVLELQFTEFRC